MSIGTSGDQAVAELNPEGIAERTTVGVFFSQAAKFGGRPLVHYPDGEAWKVHLWSDMKRDVLAVASALIEAGVKQGDRVILMSENRLEWLYCDFGIQTAGAVTVPILPYSHVFARINSIFVGLCFGGETWISRGTDHLAQEIGFVRPTIMCSVPRVYEKMHAAVMSRVREAPGYRRSLFGWAVGVGRKHNVERRSGALLDAQYRLADRLVLSALRRRLTGGRLRFFISGGAALAREVEEFFWSIGVPILNGWGMTEMSSGASTNTLTDHKFLTVGKPLPGVQVKIAEDGEILVNSPGNMLSYHRNPESTAETMRDGWIYTGDIGEIDADGFLRITDRKKALFKTAGGKYIAPQPIEFALMRDPLIDRAVVVGDGRPYVSVLIVPDRGVAKQQGLDDGALKARIQGAIDEANKHLGHWETIKYFALLDHDFTEESGELSLKLDVKRKVVSQHYAAQIESMYAGKCRPGA